MSILISAPIRTGKTLLAIEKIFEELNRGRIVYTNIIDIKIPGVISVSSSINDPFDWRDLPNGSVLVWDEAHEHPAFSEQDLLKTFKINEQPFDDLLEKLNNVPNATTAYIRSNIDKIEKAKKHALEKRKEEIRDIGRGLLLHGHFGIEIYFITQRVAKLNTDVLASVTNHYVLRRKFGIDAATIWEFGEAITTWSKSAADSALNKRFWRYPKHLYHFYKSSEHHAVKKTFPLKYAAIALIPILLIANGFRQAYESNFMGWFGKKEQVQAQPQQQNQNVPSQNPEHSQALEVAQKAASLGMTPEQYLDLQNPEHRNQQLASQNPQQAQTYSIKYDYNDPFNVKTDQQYTATSLPTFSGCIKYAGKYYAYTNQGTLIKDINPETCKRVIDNAERPYNYFAQKKVDNYAPSYNTNPQGNFAGNSQPYNSQNNSKMTPQEYEIYLNYLRDQQQANNYVQPNLQSQVIAGANAL